MEQEQQTPHKRRVRYKGKYPKKFEEKYKELQPDFLQLILFVFHLDIDVNTSRHFQSC